MPHPQPPVKARIEGLTQSSPWLDGAPRRLSLPGGVLLTKPPGRGRVVVLQNGEFGWQTEDPNIEILRPHRMREVTRADYDDALRAQEEATAALKVAEEVFEAAKKAHAAAVADYQRAIGDAAAKAQKATLIAAGAGSNPYAVAHAWGTAGDDLGPAFAAAAKVFDEASRTFTAAVRAHETAIADYFATQRWVSGIFLAYLDAHPPEVMTMTPHPG